MGFISVTCSNCGGEGSITSENSQIPHYLARRVTCNECNGEGSNLAHAGAIGSYRLHLEPMIPDDSGWDAVFSRMDADIPDLLSLFTAEPT